jgi:hypothetical protein
MSWDILVQDLPDVQRVEDIPDDFKPSTIGKRSEIIEKIRQAVPLADFSDPIWGKIEDENFSIVIHMGGDEEVTSFSFNVRGSDEAANVVSAILRRLNMRALDLGTGKFFDHDLAAEGLRRWRAYRDQIVYDAKNRS